MEHRRSAPLPIVSNNTVSKVILNRLANQSIGTGAQTVVIWDTPIVMDSIFSYNIGTGVISAPSGLYAISINTLWAASAVGVRHNVIRAIDALSVLYTSYMLPTIFTDGRLVCSTTRRLSVAGTIDFLVLQSTGGALNLIGNTTSPFLRAEIYRLGDA